ncbi:BAG family molecular chaperone regulator [Quillaja saponaria]|uniref:BAG family molecular chaperone regulator n=1 Tax=Quillaja saponaria TaxID=32244 RepID=A0AAD7PN09_QUISA|nr:BAG family molecular chaperone regulator [Quillaja saponaria]
MMKKGSNSREEVPTLENEEVVQRRDDENDGGASSNGPMIKINISYGLSQHEIYVPAQSTFGGIKKALAHKTGLEPQEQRLFFKGKEKENGEYLHMEGVKDKSKLLLLEESVDKLSERVTTLEVAVNGGTKVDEKEFEVLTEFLMRQLFKLDGIEAEGEAKLKRKAEVHRVQNFVDTIDSLKVRNSNPFSSNGNAVPVTTKWDTLNDIPESAARDPFQRSHLTTGTSKDMEISTFDTEIIEEEAHRQAAQLMGAQILAWIARTKFDNIPACKEKFTKLYVSIEKIGVDPSCLQKRIAHYVEHVSNFLSLRSEFSSKMTLEVYNQRLEETELQMSKMKSAKKSEAKKGVAIQDDLYNLRTRREALVKELTEINSRIPKLESSINDNEATVSELEKKVSMLEVELEDIKAC